MKVTSEIHKAVSIGIGFTWDHSFGFLLMIGPWILTVEWGDR